MCVSVFLCPRSPVPSLVTVPTVIRMPVPHCIAMHACVTWTCMHFPLSTCDRSGACRLFRLSMQRGTHMVFWVWDPGAGAMCV